MPHSYLQSEVAMYNHSLNLTLSAHEFQQLHIRCYVSAMARRRLPIRRKWFLDANILKGVYLDFCSSGNEDLPNREEEQKISFY
jgi:hypothetical protein